MYFNENLKLLTKLINSAFVGEGTMQDLRFASAVHPSFATSSSTSSCPVHFVWTAT